MTLTEVLDVCESLGIGVKTHSSSMEDAQADRVRRKAAREGLIRDEPPPEASKARKAPAKSTAGAERSPQRARTPSSKPAATAETADSPAPAPPRPARRPAPPKPPPAEPEPQAPAAAVEAPAASEPAPAVADESAAPAPPGMPPPDVPPPRRLVTSSGQESARPILPPQRPAPRIDEPPAPRGPAPPDAAEPGLPPPPRMPAPPKSTDGRPIPPPPAAPRSGSGKPIPPPPGPPRTSARSGGPYRTGPPGGFRRPATGTGGGGGERGRGGAPPAAGRPHPGAAPGRPGGPPGGRAGGPRGGPPRGRGRPRRRRRRQREELQPQQLTAYTPVDAPVPEGEIVIERGSTAQDVASRLNRSAADIVRFLLQQGEMVTATQSLNDDMIELFAAELGAEVRITEPGAEQEEELLRALEVDLAEGGEYIRPPVVTVMGHVDHGKTLLLDRIRSANVVEGEAGGITQHIGAYQTMRGDHPITFIDTPGHEAFTAMRARGAQATDVVVLVVAADDGVMPQTVEAIDHARAADVPIIVAINKMDRPGADPDRVHAQLAERGLVPETYGGEVITVPMSAMTGDGIDELLDQILLVAELEELTADPTGRAVGIVLEAHLDRGRGPVATVVVQRGTLAVGEPMVAGAAWGRVRAMTDDRGNPLTEAGPSAPVQVLGLGEVARAGDMFVVAPDEKTAGKVAETREHWQRQASLAGTAGGSGGGARLEDIFKQVQAGETATLNLVLKADVHGSLEAVTDSLRKLERDDVKLTFVSRGVGGINENDVQLAAASEATIIGFNVRPDRNARQAAEAENVEVRLYEIIYDLISDVQNAMVGLLEPEFEEVVVGEAQVRQVFRISGVGPVAGCVVEHGNVRSGAKVRFLRDGTIIWKGSISSLRHFQDDVAEVSAGMECGIGLSDFSDLKEGDVIETYTEREIARVA